MASVLLQAIEEDQRVKDEEMTTLVDGIPGFIPTAVKYYVLLRTGKAVDLSSGEPTEAASQKTEVEKEEEEDETEDESTVEGSIPSGLSSAASLQETAASEDEEESPAASPSPAVVGAANVAGGQMNRSGAPPKLGQNAVWRRDGKPQTQQPLPRASSFQVLRPSSQARAQQMPRASSFQALADSSSDSESEAEEETSSSAAGPERSLAAPNERFGVILETGTVVDVMSDDWAACGPRKTARRASAPASTTKQVAAAPKSDVSSTWTSLEEAGEEGEGDGQLDDLYYCRKGQRHGWTRDHRLARNQKYRRQVDFQSEKRAVQSAQARYIAVCKTLDVVDS